MTLLVNPKTGLFLVALLWGTSFPVVRIALQSVAAMPFVTARFALAGLAFSALLAIPLVRAEVRRIFLPGMWIGFLNFFIFMSQTLALETISGPRAAFITGSYVVFVPMLSRTFGRPAPVLLDWLSSATAFVGLSILAAPFSNGAFTGILTGDLFALMCAAFAAIKIHTLTTLARSGANAFAIAFLQVAGVILLAALAWPFLPSTWLVATWTPTAIACVIYCAWGITLGSFYLQSSCQRHVAPQEAALIFCLEPVFATVFSFLLVGEKLGTTGLVGGALILAAQTLTPLVRLLFKRP
jgi:drug/metabolite transporter (DMT)-like permease